MPACRPTTEPWEPAPNARRFFGGGAPKDPQPKATPPRKSDTDVKAEAARQRQTLRQRRGRASTILTQGVAGDADVPTSQPLGGTYT